MLVWRFQTRWRVATSQKRPLRMILHLRLGQINLVHSCLQCTATFYAKCILCVLRYETSHTIFTRLTSPGWKLSLNLWTVSTLNAPIRPSVTQPASGNIGHLQPTLTVSHHLYFPGDRPELPGDSWKQWGQCTERRENILRIYSLQTSTWRWVRGALNIKT